MSHLQHTTDSAVSNLSSDKAIQQLMAFFALQPDDEGTPLPAPTRVFRIEFPNGCGPFNSCGINPANRAAYDRALALYDQLCAPGYCFKMLKNYRGKMGITEEPFRAAHGEAAYGCRNLSSVREWFPLPARKLLANHGARLLAFNLPAGAPLLDTNNCGEVVFARSSATTYEVWDLCDLAPVARANQLPIHNLTGVR